MNVFKMLLMLRMLLQSVVSAFMTLLGVFRFVMPSSLFKMSFGYFAKCAMRV